MSFKNLFDSAHDMIQMVDLNEKIIYVNQSWSRILGYPLQEIMDQNIYTFIHSDDRFLYKQYRQDIIEGKQNKHEVLVRFINNNGTTIYIEGFISLQNQDHLPLYTFAIFRDVTHKVKNEQLLKNREFNLQQLLVNAPDAIIVINPESNIIFWNPASENLFGWKTEEVIHKPLSYTIIPSQYREAHLLGMKRFLTTNEAHVLNKTIEISAMNKAGEEFYISLTISTTTFNGSPAFISFIRDIREKRRNEAELEKKRLQLESSNKLLEQFAHVASHDMKEPVRKIMMFGGILKDELGDGISSTAKEYLHKIDVASQRLVKLVEGVLEYSTAQNIEGSFELIDLNVLLQNIQTDLEIPIKEKGAIIQYNELPVIYGIDFLVYQLFYNLVNNSLKFIQKSVRPNIQISARLSSETYHALLPAPYIEIKIKDNGIGFNQIYATTIFQTFTRLNNRREYEGTGLGLSLCKTIMERHKGVIMAESEDGKGATFTLLFPQLQG